MKEKKDILLICQTFPPAPGIGGRRCPKFSKHLSRMGYRMKEISDLQFDQHQLQTIFQELQKAEAFHPDFQYQQYSYPVVTQELLRLIDGQQHLHKTQQIHV